MAFLQVTPSTTVCFEKKTLSLPYFYFQSRIGTPLLQEKKVGPGHRRSDSIVPSKKDVLEHQCQYMKCATTVLTIFWFLGKNSSDVDTSVLVTVE